MLALVPWCLFFAAFAWWFWRGMRRRVVWRERMAGVKKLGSELDKSGVGLRELASELEARRANRTNPPSARPGRPG